jgi:hypothetical protein
MALMEYCLVNIVLGDAPAPKVPTPPKPPEPRIDNIFDLPPTNKVKLAFVPTFQVSNKNSLPEWQTRDQNQ